MEVGKIGSLASSIRRQIVKAVTTYDGRRVATIAKLLGRLIEFNPRPVVVAGLNTCVMAVLDYAMVGFDDVDILVPPFHAVLVTGWRAERLLEEIGWNRQAEGVYAMSTCLIRDKCVYHFYVIRDEGELQSLAAYLTLIALVNNLAAKSYSRMQCTEPYGDCVELVVEKLRALAHETSTPITIKYLDMVTDPHKIYCMPDILAEHTK